MADTAKRMSTRTSRSWFDFGHIPTERGWWISFVVALLWCCGYVWFRETQVGGATPDGHHGSKGLFEFVLQISTVLGISFFWFRTVLYVGNLRAAERPASSRRQRATDRRAQSELAVISIAPLSQDPGSGTGKESVIRAWIRQPATPLVLATVPGLVFAYATRNDYNSAVFVMALVAIYVAAEHYGALEEQKAEHRAAADELRETLKSNERHIGTLLNRDGLAKWKHEVYQNYLAADERISAVIRILDIDEEWWGCTNCAAWDSPSDEAWRAAFDKYRTVGGSTLYHVLLNAEQSRAARAAAPAQKIGRRDKVQFAVEMPWPLDASPSAERFDDIYGLVWQLVIINEVREARRRPADLKVRDDGSIPYVRMRVASAPFWMHAVDNTVYQVLERKRDEKRHYDDMQEEDEAMSAATRSRRAMLERSSARDITDEMTRQSDQHRLSDWAHADIRHYAARGCNAEEYVFSVLRLAAFQAELEEGTGLIDANVESILRQLGLQEWLESASHRKPQKDVKCAKNICISTFRQLLRLRLAEQTRALVEAPALAHGEAKASGSSPEPTAQLYRLSDLWHEVL